MPGEDVLGIGCKLEVALAEVHSPSVDEIEECVLIILVAEGETVAEGEECRAEDDEEEQRFSSHRIQMN